MIKCVLAYLSPCPPLSGYCLFMIFQFSESLLFLRQKKYVTHSQRTNTQDPYLRHGFILKKHCIAVITSLFLKVVLIFLVSCTLCQIYSLNNRLSNSFVFVHSEKHGFKPFLRRYIFLNSHAIFSAAYGHFCTSCLSIHPAVAAAPARDLCRSCAARLCLRRFAPAPGRENILIVLALFPPSHMLLLQ